MLQMTLAPWLLSGTPYTSCVCFCCACWQVYKGVVPPGEFSSMVDDLCSGPCIAVEVRAHMDAKHTLVCRHAAVVVVAPLTRWCRHGVLD
jgi:hypothetical protein